MSTPPREADDGSDKKALAERSTTDQAKDDVKEKAQPPGDEPKQQSNETAEQFERRLARERNEPRGAQRRPRGVVPR